MNFRKAILKLGRFLYDLANFQYYQDRFQLNYNRIRRDR